MTEVGCRYVTDVKVLPSMCGSDSRLSIAAALDMFQDTATVHADNFDIGPDGMERRNYFWVITKTRIHMFRMPKMMEEVQSCTWIQAPDRASCERDYSITAGDELLAYGRSVWAIMSRDTGRLVHLKELYPELDFSVAPPDDRPFLRISRDFSEAELIGEYRVRSVDIDLGGHMNNVNYVRAMLGCFMSEELSAAGISELEVNFIHQTYEGETLSFRRRDTPDGFEVGALDSEGRTVFTAAFLTCRG